MLWRQLLRRMVDPLDAGWNWIWTEIGVGSFGMLKMNCSAFRSKVIEKHVFFVFFEFASVSTNPELRSEELVRYVILFRIFFVYSKRLKFFSAVSRPNQEILSSHSKISILLWERFMRMLETCCSDTTHSNSLYLHDNRAYVAFFASPLMCSNRIKTC